MGARADPPYLARSDVRRADNDMQVK